MKDRLLAATLDELRELNPEDLLHAIGARTIAGRAGASSPASINQHFGSLAGLAEAVLAHVFDPARLNPPRINELLTHIKDSTLPLPAAFAMHEAEFIRMTTDPEFRLRMGLWALGGDAATERFGKHLQRLALQLEEATDTLFESWGRELRPPAETTTYLAVKIALITGITLRHLTDPDDRWLHLFQRATMAIDLVMLRPVGDRHDLDARLTEMNYYPLAKRNRGPNQRNARTEARILRSANELFNTQDFARTTLDQIAKRADVGPSTMHRYYPNKQALAVALFNRNVSDDPALTTASATTLHRYLSAIAHFAGERPVLTAAFLTHLTVPHAGQVDEPLLANIRTHLTSTDVDNNRDTAEALLLHTLRRTLTHPSMPADDVAHHALDLVNH